jgi:hypothetical protein
VFYRLPYSISSTIDRWCRVSSLSAQPLVRQTLLSAGEHRSENLRTPNDTPKISALADASVVTGRPTVTARHPGVYIPGISDVTVPTQPTRSHESDWWLRNSPLQLWMTVAALEWITDHWSDHLGDLSTIVAGLDSAFKLAKGDDFDLSQHDTFGYRQVVDRQYVEKYKLRVKQSRVNFKRRTLIGLRQEWAATQLMAPRAAMSVLEWVRLARLYNHGTVEFLNKGAYEQGKQATSQCAQAAKRYGLDRQGLDLCSEENLFKIRAAGVSKLPGDNGRQLVRSPTHEKHGIFSIVKQHSGWEMYVECTKSLEGASKALAIRCLHSVALDRVLMC